MNMKDPSENRDVNPAFRKQKKPGSVNRYIHPLSSFRQQEMEESVFIDPHSSFLEQNLKQITREEFTPVVRNDFLDKQTSHKVERDYKENPFLISQIFGDGDMLEVNDPKHKYKHYFEAVTEAHGIDLIERAYYDFQIRNYIPTPPRTREATVEDYVYQMKDMHKRLNVKQHFVTTCPHEDMDKIYKDWFEAGKTIGYRKKMAKDLGSYITEETLAHIYELIGLEWVHTDNMIGLDLRKFEKNGVFRFRNFLKQAFKINGFVARATDSRFIIIFFYDEAKKLIDLIQPYVFRSFFIKIGDGNWGTLVETNKGPAILKMHMEAIEIIKESPYDQEEDEKYFSLEDQ
jgi:hypothetical protein